MKRTYNYAAALATTASVALLAGAAHAQLSPAPTPCTTTMESPHVANCVLPTASAPGGGSFPGSFLVPGTNTSFALHGIIWIQANRDIGPHEPIEAPGQDSIVVDGPGVSAATRQQHATNGGFNIDAKLTRPTIETRTPTAYGLLKTYIEFDFNQTATPQLSGNKDLIRLRHAYGTLGPWLIGQTFTLLQDPAAIADTADGSLDPGQLESPTDRKDQVRYTWLAGNGLSIAGAVEARADSPGLNNAVGTALDNGSTITALSSNSNLSSADSFTNYPNLAAAAEWDQPWGHIRFSAVGGINNLRASTHLLVGSTQPTNISSPEFAFGLTGHLNTHMGYGNKDILKAGTRFFYDAADYTNVQSTGGVLFNATTGQRDERKEWAGFVSYEHFWTGQWRSNVTGGYSRLWGNPGFGDVATRAQIDTRFFYTHLNVIYSPVPQTDFYLEWVHYDREVLSGAEGRDERIIGSFRFYF